MKPNFPQGRDGKRRIFEKEMAELPRIMRGSSAIFSFAPERNKLQRVVGGRSDFYTHRYTYSLKINAR
jgi:hypothetical protein